MANVYDQHRASFANVSAYVIVKDNERIASVAFKFPRDGAGRLLAYVHVFGAPMIRAYASGYGYDKRSAAVSAAARKIVPANHTDFNDGKAVVYPSHAHAVALKAAMEPDNGYDWTRRVEDAGYRVFQAV